MTASSPDLRATLAELQGILADERRAIARLELPTIESLTERKLALIAALSAVGDHARRDPELARLVNRLRLGVAANASLLATAKEAIAVLLGHDPSPGYDRRARSAAGPQSRGRALTL